MIIIGPCDTMASEKARVIIGGKLRKEVIEMTELQALKIMGFLSVFMRIGMWVVLLAAADWGIKAYRRIRRGIRCRRAF